MSNPKSTTKIVSWGKITSHPLDEFCFSQLKRSPYAALIIDLLLRLEKTPASEMLDVPFPNEDAAHKCKATLARWFHKHKGKGFVRLGVAPNDMDGWSVLVARGPLYDNDKSK
jgi:hypothetical protein